MHMHYTSVAEPSHALAGAGQSRFPVKRRKVKVFPGGFGFVPASAWVGCTNYLVSPMMWGFEAAGKKQAFPYDSTWG